MRIPPKLLLLFIAVPVIEVFLFIKVGGAIGLGATLGVIVITAILGAALTRSQGTRAIERFQKTALAGKPPRSEVFDGLFILLAGIFLITPGFLTDLVGLLLLLPPVRKFVKTRVTAAVGSHLSTQFQGFHGFQAPSPEVSPPSAPRRRVKKRRSRSGEKIVDAEIIED